MYSRILNFNDEGFETNACFLFNGDQLLNIGLTFGKLFK